MEKFLIRQCTLDDIDAIFQLDSEWEHEGVSYEFIPISREDFIAQFERFEKYHLVVEAEGIIVGYVNGSVRQGKKSTIISNDDLYLEIENIYIKSEFRNREFGGSLLEQLLETARQDGIQRFFVSTVTRDMHKILNFYQSHGFKPSYVELFI